VDPVAIYFTGTAGAGKTTLTRAFHDWMDHNGYDALTVNLDPGMEEPGYDPNLDIRDWVKLSDIQKEYGLGPNGAQVAAADVIALKVFEIKEQLDRMNSDYILVDTPGQVELFAFRESSKAIVESLTGERSMIAFLFDPALAKSPKGFVSLLMLSATVQFRFGLPLTNVLAKEDLLKPSDRARLQAWGEEPFSLYEAVRDESPESDTGLSLELFRALETIGPLWQPVYTSAETGSGMEEIYASAQRVFSGGEDLEKSGGSPPSD
jgi:GPN-loop GTPase